MRYVKLYVLEMKKIWRCVGYSGKGLDASVDGVDVLTFA